MKFYCVIICAFAATFAKAQITKDTLQKEIPEVAITGTRTERNIETLPLPVTVIDGKTIQKAGISRLNEIIQEQTGLIIVSDFGGGEGIQMQGLASDYVMILIDGQPLVGRTAGTLDLTRISVNNIDRIEVIKGASSSLYGSEALAGVVNIITKKVKLDNQFHLNANYKYGTFNTNDVSNNLQYGKNKVGFELGLNYYRTDGYNINNNQSFTKSVEPFSNFTIQPKVRVKFSEKVDAVFNVRNYFQDQDYKAVILNEDYKGKSTINEGNYSVLVDETVSDKLKLVYDLYATVHNQNDFLNDPNDQRYSEDYYKQRFYRPEVRAHYKMGRNTLTTGVGLNYETLDRNLFDKKAELNSEYFYGQYEWFFKKKWNVIAGFRYDHHHQYESQLSPKLAINYEVNENFSLKTSLGYGYKAPDLRQLYLNFTNPQVGYTVLGYNLAVQGLALLQQQGQISNTYNFDFSSPLKPESSVNYNFGGYYKKEKLSGNFNLFYNNITNLIDTKIIAQKYSGQNVFSYFNINQVFTYGVELNATYSLLSNLSISGGYQFLIAKDQSEVDQFKDGEVFARDKNTLIVIKLKPSDYFGLFDRSKHTANIKINYQIPSWKSGFDLRIIYRSKFGSLDTNDDQVLDKYDIFIKGYFLTNLTLNKDLKHGISLQAGALNLFNYKDPKNISNLPGSQFFGRLLYAF